MVQTREPAVPGQPPRHCRWGRPGDRERPAFPVARPLRGRRRCAQRDTGRRHSGGAHGSNSATNHASILPRRGRPAKGQGGPPAASLGSGPRADLRESS